MPTALITGITGQDGSYLAELLLAREYEVHGVVRRASMFNRSRIEHLRSDPLIYNRRLFLHYADLVDTTTLRRIVARLQPQELYHFAGQSHVGLSFEIPESTCAETAEATLSLLEMCRDLANPPRIFHAASSEVFGSPASAPQDETTAFRPVSPYGCAKAFAANICRVYREAHRLFVCNGIAYNHESPRRAQNFVTRKITIAAARMARSTGGVLELGNLSAQRDWGYSPEYVEAMWRMLQREEPDDYVLATGTAATVRDFASAAFAAVGIALDFEGEGLAETGRDRSSGKIVLRVNADYCRPADPVCLVGNAAHAARELGWTPATKGAQVAEKMATADYDQLGEE